jgi:hypothetical protein
MIDLPFNSIDFSEAWSDYLDNKLENHKFEYKSERSMKAALKKLYRYAHGKEEIAIAILENSISENWRGFFPLQYNDPLMIKLRQESVNAPKKKSAAQIIQEVKNGTYGNNS